MINIDLYIMSGHKRKTVDLPTITDDFRSDSPCLSSHKLVNYSISDGDGDDGDGDISGCSSGCCIIPSTPIEELEKASNNDITPTYVIPMVESTGFDYVTADGQHKKYIGKRYGSIILHLNNGIDYACDFSDIVFPLDQLQNVQPPTAYRVISGVPLAFVGDISLNADVKTVNAYRQLRNMRITTQTVMSLMDVWMFIKKYGRTTPNWFYDVIKLILKTKLSNDDHSDIHGMLNPVNIEAAIATVYRKLWVCSIGSIGSMDGLGKME